MKWTKHAIQRVKETPIKLNWAKKMLVKASKSTLKKKIEAWKFERYGMKQVEVSYREISLNIIYTVDEKNGEVITFTVKNKMTREVFGREL